MSGRGKSLFAKDERPVLLYSMAASDVVLEGQKSAPAAGRVFE
jgi:hypothetical protein